MDATFDHPFASGSGQKGSVRLLRKKPCRSSVEMCYKIPEFRLVKEEEFDFVSSQTKITAAELGVTSCFFCFFGKSFTEV